MTFGAPFSRAIRPPFGQNLATGGVWWLSGGIAAANCIAAYQPKGAADLSASYVNLANPGTYNAAPGTAPTWDATNGWKFLGTSSQYLTTGITPATGWSAIIRYSNNSGAGCLFGVYNYSAPASGMVIFPNITSKVYYYNPAALSVSPNLDAGVLGVAGNNAYRNGVQETGSLSGTWNTMAGIYIGAIDRVSDGVRLSYLTGYIQAMAIYNADISTSMTALTTAINAL